MTTWVVQNNKIHIQDGGRPPYCLQWTDLDETWVVTSHHVREMSAMMRLPWHRPLPIATAHCTFSSYGRLEAERVNQFWWNLVHNSKLGPQWQSHDQLLNFLKFKMADGRHVRKYSKCHNSHANEPTGTKLGWSHPITFPTYPPWCGCHGNGRCLPTAHWTFCSYGRLEAERWTDFDEIWYTTYVRTTIIVPWSHIKC